ncbi:MAG TPA: hypothetical protein VKY54_14745 [Kiloniellales bacterium]|jgi:hypothetical protein|nr:hypothetical protein [Kiloniellales bacterium]
MKIQRLLVVGLVLLPFLAPGISLAQDRGYAAAFSPSTDSLVAEERIDGYRILAIGAGAAAGAVLTHMAIGSYVAPLVAKSGLAAVKGMSSDYLIARITASLAGGAAGGVLGDRLYQHWTQ